MTITDHIGFDTMELFVSSTKVLEIYMKTSNDCMESSAYFDFFDIVVYIMAFMANMMI